MSTTKPTYQNLNTSFHSTILHVQSSQSVSTTAVSNVISISRYNCSLTCPSQALTCAWTSQSAYKMAVSNVIMISLYNCSLTCSSPALTCTWSQMYNMSAMMMVTPGLRTCISRTRRNLTSERTNYSLSANICSMHPCVA